MVSMIDERDEYILAFYSAVCSLSLTHASLTTFWHTMFCTRNVLYQWTWWTGLPRASRSNRSSNS